MRKPAALRRCNSQENFPRARGTHARLFASAAQLCSPFTYLSCISAKGKPFIPINIQYRQPLTLLLFPQTFFDRSSPLLSSSLNVSHTLLVFILPFRNNTWKYPNYPRSSPIIFHTVEREREEKGRHYSTLRWRWKGGVLTYAHIPA